MTEREKKTWEFVALCSDRRRKKKELEMKARGGMM